jgi:hypothetical protein
MHDHWAAEGEKTLVDRLGEKAAALRRRPPAFELEAHAEAELQRLTATTGPA